MNHKLALAFIAVGFVAATSPVWAADTGIVFTPDPAFPGQSVGFSAGVDPSNALQESPCVVSAVKGEPPPSDAGCGFVDTTLLTGYVVVPTDAPTGASYSIEVCGGCAPEFEYLQTGAVGVVASPPPPPTASATVPTSHCSGWSQTYKRLYAVGLHLVTPRFPDPIWYLRPSGGAVVTPGTEVTAYPARVPALAQLTYPSASALVVARCGFPTPAGPTDGLVIGQVPEPGAALPSDRVVVVSLSATPEPHPQPQPQPTPPVPPTPHHHWWWRVAHHHVRTVTLGGLSLVLLAGGAAGFHRVKPRRGPQYGRRVDYQWAPDSAGRFAPSLVIRRQPSTYDLEELP